LALCDKTETTKTGLTWDYGSSARGFREKHALETETFLFGWALHWQQNLRRGDSPNHTGNNSRKRHCTSTAFGIAQERRRDGRSEVRKHDEAPQHSRAKICRMGSFRGKRDEHPCHIENEESQSEDRWDWYKKESRGDMNRTSSLRQKRDALEIEKKAPVISTWSYKKRDCGARVNEKSRIGVAAGEEDSSVHDDCMHAAESAPSRSGHGWRRVGLVTLYSLYWAAVWTENGFNSALELKVHFDESEPRCFLRTRSQECDNKGIPLQEVWEKIPNNSKWYYWE
jgi:hypothetical protein